MVDKVEKIGYLWQHETKKDNDIIYKGYIDLGIIGKFNIKVLPNKHKHKDTQPDYDVISNGQQMPKKSKINES